MDYLNIDFHYLAPKGGDLIHHPADYIKSGDGAKALRRIFGKTAFDQFEKDKVIELENVLKKSNIPFPPGIRWNEVLALRFLYSTSFNLSKAIDDIKLHNQFKKEQAESPLSEKQKDLLFNGLIYCSGRDNQQRPIIIVDLGRHDKEKVAYLTFNKNKGTIGTYLAIYEKYAFMPGCVENWIILIDTHDNSLFSSETTVNVLHFSELQLLEDVIKLIQAAFPSCTDQLFILNPSFSLSASWAIVDGFVSNAAAMRIKLLDSNNFGILLDKIPGNSLEKRYGGYSPNIINFWLPEGRPLPTNNNSKFYLPSFEITDRESNYSKSNYSSHYAALPVVQKGYLEDIGFKPAQAAELVADKEPTHPNPRESKSRASKGLFTPLKEKVFAEDFAPINRGNKEVYDDTDISKPRQTTEPMMGDEYDFNSNDIVALIMNENKKVKRAAADVIPTEQGIVPSRETSPTKTKQNVDTRNSVKREKPRLKLPEKSMLNLPPMQGAPRESSRMPTFASNGDEAPEWSVKKPIEDKKPKQENTKELKKSNPPEESSDEDFFFGLCVSRGSRKRGFL